MYRDCAIPRCKQKRFVSTGQCIVGLIGIAILFCVLSTIETFTYYTFLLAVVCVLCAGPWVVLHQGGTEVSEPIYWTIVCLTLAYPVRVIAVLLFHDSTTLVPFQYDDRLMAEGLLYVIAGFVAYYFGYWRRTSQGLDGTVRKWSKKLFAGVRDEWWSCRVFVLYLFGSAVRYYMIRSGNFATYVLFEGYDQRTNALLSYLADTCVFAYIIAWVYMRRESRRTNIGIMICTLVIGGEIFYTAITLASKTYLIRLLVYPLLVDTLLRKKFRVVLSVLILGVTIFVIFPFIQSYRGYFNQDVTQVVSLEENLAVAKKATGDVYKSEETSYEDWSKPVTEFVDRWHGFDSLALLIDRVPGQYDYLYGRDLALLPFVLIPRFIMPFKPSNDVVKHFSADIVGGGGATSPFPIGEGYLNFGMLGVIVLMYGLGAVQRIVYRNGFAPVRESSLAVGVYTYFFFSLTNVDSWLLGILTGLIQRGVVIGLCVLFMKLKVTSLPSKLAQKRGILMD